MAGFISRFKRITVSRINAFLETVEEPETILPQLIREIQRSIGDAAKAENTATAACKTSQRRLDESMGRSIRLEKGAEMALRYGDESLAREALTEQFKAERLCEDQHNALQQSETAQLEARELRLHLQGQLQELKHRKNEIITRSRSVKKATGTHRSTNRIRTAGAAILDEVSRMQEIHGNDDTYGFSPGLTVRPPENYKRSLEDRLRTLEQESEIERRLDSIRKKKQSKPDVSRP